MFGTFTKILIAVFLLASVVGLSEAQIVRDGLVSYWSFNDSKLDGTLANPGGYTNNDLMLRIGWDPHAEDRHYVGVIDEVAIYDRALTPNEIVQNQNASLGITSVDPAGKLSSTWGEIKAGY